MKGMEHLTLRFDAATHHKSSETRSHEDYTMRQETFLGAC